MERSADLHMAHLMPLPLTVSCFSKIQTGFTFLVPGHPGSPEQRTVKRVFVCVCERERETVHTTIVNTITGNCRTIGLSILRAAIAKGNRRRQTLPLTPAQCVCVCVCYTHLRATLLQ